MSSGLGGDNRALQDETQHRVEVSSPQGFPQSCSPKAAEKNAAGEVGNVPASPSLPGLTQGWCKRCHQGTGTVLLPQLMGTRTAWERSSLLQVHEKSGKTSDSTRARSCIGTCPTACSVHEAQMSFHLLPLWAVFHGKLSSSVWSPE